MINLVYPIKAKYFTISFCLISFAILSHTAKAARVDTLFVSDDIIRMELRTDFSAIQKERTGKPKYHKGELVYYTPGKEPTTLTVRVMARGNFRLNPSNCNFPPLYVDFKKNEVKNTLFDNQDRLKLVTPCQTDEYVVDEYTVYKMYNQVTDQSMKVRLAEVLYFDTGLNKKVFERHSFFIEDKDHVAERNNAFAKDRVITPFDLDRESYKRLAVFQYIIGNRDWFVSSRKNIIIMQPKDTTQPPFAVPYDFDFSAFVNAEYTKPKDVPEDILSDRRVYKGLCYTDDEFKEVFDFYRGLRPAFESMINNQTLISKYTRKQILRYIDDFYSILDKRDVVKHVFQDACETKAIYNLAGD